MEIDLGRLDGFVTEPEGDDGATDTFAQKFHRRSVPQTVRGHILPVERRTEFGRQCDVLPDDALYRITAETAISVADEQRPVDGVGPLVEPSAEYGHGVCPERCRAILAPLAAAPDVSARAENDIAAAEIDQLGHPESGLHKQLQKGSVPSSVPGRHVGGGEKSLDLLAVEVIDHALLVALRGQGENPPTVMQEFRFVDGDVFEERSDGRQPVVAGAGAVAPRCLQEVEEPADKEGIDIGDQKVGRLTADTGS